MSEWISVRVRLPEEKEPVIILLQDGQIFRGEIRKRQSLPEWWYYYDAGDTDTDMLGLLYQNLAAKTPAFRHGDTAALKEY